MSKFESMPKLQRQVSSNVSRKIREKEEINKQKKEHQINTGNNDLCHKN